MTQIVNLDKIETKREKIVILNGKEHFMRTLSVRDYIDQMKRSEQIEKLTVEADANSASKVLELTIEALDKLFPTIGMDALKELTFEQITMLRRLADANSAEELEGEVNEGEAEGETDS